MTKRVRKDIILIENVTVTQDTKSKVVRFSNKIERGFYDIILIPK